MTARLVRPAPRELRARAANDDRALNSVRRRARERVRDTICWLTWANIAGALVAAALSALDALGFFAIGAGAGAAALAMIDVYRKVRHGRR